MTSNRQEDVNQEQQLLDTMSYIQPTKRLRQYLMLESVSSAEGTRLTQRRIARISGISPSVVNQYLLEFETAGWIDRSSLNQRDYTYSLTKSGSQVRREMLVDYIRETFQLFSAGKTRLSAILKSHQERYRIKRLVFYTAGEVTELLIHSLPGTSMTLIAIADDDPQKHGQSFFGHPIISPREITSYHPDAVIVTSFRYRQRIAKQLEKLESQGIHVIGF